VNVKGQVDETGSKLLHTWCIAQKLQPRRFTVDYTNSRKVEMYMGLNVGVALTFIRIEHSLYWKEAKTGARQLLSAPTLL
jgi:hypothetical protein